MSFHLDQELPNKPNREQKKIEMPPLPAEQPQQEQKVEQTYDVHPDIQKEFVQHTVEEVTEPQREEQVEEVVEEKPQETFQAKNFRQLKEQKEAIARERDEFARRLKEYEAKQQPQQKLQAEEEKEDEFLPEDVIEAKHLRRYDKKIRELEEKLNNAAQQVNYQTVEAKLKANFPDIEKVVSTDNIELLKASYPELAQSINANPDMYSKAAAAYTAIKKLGIMPDDSYLEDKQRAAKNAIKPRSMASLNPQQGESPLSKANAFANGLTDDLKAQLRKEMENARRGI